MSDDRQPWEHEGEQDGIRLSIAETNWLWEFSQRPNVPPYWEEAEFSRIVDKAKSFVKYGPWD